MLPGRASRIIIYTLSPRYPRELGFMDVIGGARIIIEDPNATQEKLVQIFQELAK